MNPSVTILTTVYNGEKFVERCVNSILQQTLKDFEFIVLNNGSTDSTPGILNSFSDPRLKVVHQDNLGISASLNKGAELSSSDLIARLDADDYCFPARLEHQVKFMRQYPNIVLCGSRWSETVDGELLKQRVPFIETDRAIRKSMCLFNPFSHSMVMFRRKTFFESGGYSCKYKYTQDYDLWMRMLNFGEAKNLKEELGVVRVSKQSESFQNAKEQKLEALRIRWNALLKFGGNPIKAVYYLIKTLLGLLFP